MSKIKVTNPVVELDGDEMTVCTLLTRAGDERETETGGGGDGDSILNIVANSA